jgi:Leu/Phe-tRNA-protein transferase
MARLEGCMRELEKWGASVNLQFMETIEECRTRREKEDNELDRTYVESIAQMSYL